MKRWFLACTFAALAGIELALGPVLVTPGGAGPDLILVLAVFLALRAPWGLSLFVYLALGTFSDVFAVPHPGLRGFTYVLTAVFVERINPGRLRRNSLVLAALCAVAAIGVETVYMALAARDWPDGPGAAFNVALTSALLTGAAGLVLGPILNLVSRATGWPPAAGPLTWSQLLAAATAGASRGSRGRRG